jgi:hypothetical protein
VPDNPNIKIPLDKEHFPYALDEEDMFKLHTIQEEKYKRHELSEPEDFGDAIKIPLKYYAWYYATKVKALNEPKLNPALKNMTYGHTTIYRPDRQSEELAFEALSPDQLYKDKIMEKNEYVIDPVFGDINPDLPKYALKFLNPINITEEGFKNLRKYYINNNYNRVSLATKNKIQKHQKRNRRRI